MISEKEYLIVILTLFFVMVMILYFYPKVILSEHRRLRTIFPTDSPERVTEWVKNNVTETYIHSSSIEMPSDSFLCEK